jgi:hypothetical protein
MRCHRKRKRRHCFRDEDCFPRHRKHHRHHGHHRHHDDEGAHATVNNTAKTGAQSAGIANVNVQVPINLGDATAINRSSGNSVSTLL